MAKVRATEKGYDGVAVRSKGDVFEWNQKLAKWMEPVGGKKGEVAVEAPPAAAEEFEPSEAPPNAKDKHKNSHKSK